MPSMPATNRRLMIQFHFHHWFCFFFFFFVDGLGDTRHRHRTACRFVVSRFHNEISHSPDTTSRNGMEPNGQNKREAAVKKKKKTVKRENSLIAGGGHVRTACDFSFFCDWIERARAPFFFSRLYYLVFCVLQKPSTAVVRQMDL